MRTPVTEKEDGEVTKMYRAKVYRRRNGEWSWTLYDRRNGKKIATCGEGYKNLTHARAMVFKLFGIIT